MDKAEYLLTCVAEESSEVGKEACKSLRFGPANYYRDQEQNGMLMLREFYELSAAIQMWAEESGFTVPAEVAQAWMEDKRRRLTDTMLTSVQLGTLRMDVSAPIEDVQVDDDGDV